MKKEAPRSLSGIQHAQDLLKALPPEDPAATHHTPARLYDLISGAQDACGRPTRPISMCARRCYNGHYDDGTVRWTGGVIIKASLPRLSHQSGMGTESTRRLKPGWTDEHFLNAANRCFTEMRAKAHNPLEQARENLFQRFEKLTGGKPSQKVLDAIDKDTTAVQDGETVTYCTDYQEMTMADVAWWNDFISEWGRNFPDPNEARAVPMTPIWIVADDDGAGLNGGFIWSTEEKAATDAYEQELKEKQAANAGAVRLFKLYVDFDPLADKEKTVDHIYGELDYCDESLALRYWYSQEMHDYCAEMRSDGSMAFAKVNEDVVTERVASNPRP